MQRLSLRALITACVVSLPSPADVLVVDAAGGPGATHTDLQPAIDDALNGDILLVRSGTYRDFGILNKSLSVIADSGAEVVVDGLVRVRDLGISKSVVIAGVEVLAPPNPFGVTPLWPFRIQDCIGSVLVQDVVVRQTANGGGLGLFVVSDSSATSLVRCEVDDRGHIYLVGVVAASGLGVLDSNMSLFDSSMTGLSAETPSLPGGPGIHLSGGSLHVSGSTATGGAGADAKEHPFGGCSDAGDGGHGIHIAEPSELYRLDTESVAGPAGQDISGIGCVPPKPGQPIAGTGTVTTLAHVARSQVVSSPVRHGETLSVTHTGETGDFVLAIYSTSLSPTPFLSVTNGPLIPNVLSLHVDALGVVPAGGQLTTTLTVSFPQPGLAAQAFVQGVFLTPGGEAVVSGGEVLVYLGPGL